MSAWDQAAPNFSAGFQVADSVRPENMVNTHHTNEGSWLEDCNVPALLSPLPLSPPLPGSSSISFSLIFMILTLYKIAGQLCCGVPLSVFPHNSMRAVHLWQECHGSNVRFFLLHFIKWLLISPDFCILKLLIFPLQLAFCGEKL